MGRIRTNSYPSNPQVVKTYNGDGQLTGMVDGLVRPLSVIHRRDSRKVKAAFGRTTLLAALTTIDCVRACRSVLTAPIIISMSLIACKQS